MLARFQKHRVRRGGLSEGRKLSFECCESRALLSAASVISSADDGPGSFRAAIISANNDSSINSIVFDRRIDAIRLQSSINYTGSQSLRIHGNVATIQSVTDKQGDFDLLVASGGADIALSQITFRGGARGVVVDVPLTATGQIEVSLDRVTIADNDLFGLHVIDLKEIPPSPDDPDADPTEVGASAGVVLSVLGSHITGNGTAAHDQDGIRVDERGMGGINATILHSHLDGNGAEGIELDEAGQGTVTLNVAFSTFDSNGFISSGDPEDPDFDDGIDIDEVDEGSVIAVIVNSTASGNFDEGIDLNEDGQGDMSMTLINVRADGNTDDGIALEELGEGTLRATLIQVRASRNGDSGLKFEEFDTGDLAVDIAFSQIEENGDYGIFASQAQPGTGLIRLRHVSLRRNASGGFNTQIEDEETGELVESGVVIR